MLKKKNGMKNITRRLAGKARPMPVGTRISDIQKIHAPSV